MPETDPVYSEIILELYKDPLHKGTVPNANVKADGGNITCGDHVTFTLRIKDGKIEDIKFEGNGCAISTAAECLLAEKVKGKSVEEAKKLSPDDVFEMLGGVIQTRIKCATLGLSVLHAGIEAYEKHPGEKLVRVSTRV